MAGVSVDDRDHPVGGDLAGDPEHPIVALLQVLAHHRGQQPHGLGHRLGERAALQQRQRRVRIPGARSHQRLPHCLVVPVDLRLGRRGVLLPAGQGRLQFGRQRLVGRLEQPPDGRAQQRDGVHGGHRVIQRRGVQHPPHPDQPGLPGSDNGDRTDPLGLG